MKIDCGAIHKPDYTKSCCIRFLIEMTEFSNNANLFHKFANIFLTNINHSFKSNLLSFGNYKFDILSNLLNCLTKLITYYYFINKYDYAKTVAKIAIKACMDSSYREHPEVKSKYCAILLNVAAIYER
jgi:hypothetical protein